MSLKSPIVRATAITSSAETVGGIPIALPIRPASSIMRTHNM
jgi:hypothetical protein